MATRAKDHEQQWNALHALYERGAYSLCLRPEKKILLDRLAPRYWRIKTFYILARVQVEWYRAEVNDKVTTQLIVMLTGNPGMPTSC
jgi:hypothetical protein